jgi:hypothetical protein
METKSNSPAGPSGMSVDLAAQGLTRPGWTRIEGVPNLDVKG